jgi:hypothetical protein
MTVVKSSTWKHLAPKIDREDGQMKWNASTKRENVKQNEKKREHYVSTNNK